MKKRPPLRHRIGQRGAALVEFALVFPLFATILFGTIEYGWIFYQRFNIANAIRDGIRQGVTVAQNANPDPKALAVQKAQADLAAIGISSTSITLTAQYAGSAPTRTMTLTAVLPYHPLIGLVPTPQNLQYQMTMMLELQ